MFFAKPLQRSNLCASHRQRRWLTHGELRRTGLTDPHHARFARGLDPLILVVGQRSFRSLDSQRTRHLVAKHREESVPEGYVFSGVPLLGPEGVARLE